MQEDIENKSLTLIINTSKLTARTLATAFMKFLRYSRNKIQAHQNVKPQGKQSVKQLIAQNQGVENTELADRNEAKSFDRYARQYGVDYAIQRATLRKASPGTSYTSRRVTGAPSIRRWLPTRLHGPGSKSRSALPLSRRSIRPEKRRQRRWNASGKRGWSDEQSAAQEAADSQSPLCAYRSVCDQAGRGMALG